MRVTWLACCWLMAGGAGAAGRITIDAISLEPAEVALGQPFLLRVAATGHGAEVRSYRVRTPYPVTADEVGEGFIHEGGKHAVLAGDGGALFDGAAYDQDPRPGHLAVAIPTAGLNDGVHYLVVFAHNRPGGGDQVVAWRNLELLVQGGRVRGSVLPDGQASGCEPVSFDLPDLQTISPGQPLRCAVRWSEPLAEPLAVSITPPYTWGPDEALPGFTYDPERKTGWYAAAGERLIADNSPFDCDPAPGAITVELPTDGWRPGVHVLTCTVEASSARAPHGGTGRWYRDFSVKVPAPADRLQVTVEPSVAFAEGTHFGNLTHLGEGRVVAGDRLSKDAGRTWRRLPHNLGRHSLLADGTLLAMGYRAEPLADQPGWYRVDRTISTDGGATATTSQARCEVPLATAALGHSQHVGPLFGRSVVELADGSLLAAMYGWFVGDTEPDRYRSGGTMRRSYVCRSVDRGQTWHYLSTVAYQPFLGNEGYSELVIRRLRNRTILAVVRTGGNSNPGWQDNPLMVSRSTDEGRSWEPVWRTGFEGVWPDLCELADGTLVVSTGRPGAQLIFSLDQGRTWADATPIDSERYSGYTAVCEVAPGELLVGLGQKAGVDPLTGARRNMLRLCRVLVRRR